MAIPSKNKPRVYLVSAVPMSLHAFFKRHIESLSQSNQVVLLANGSAKSMENLVAEGVSFSPVPIERQIAPWRDIRAIFSLWRNFWQGHPDLVLSVTPKAGLLSMIAARLAKTPVRVHIFTGQVWATRHGLARWLFKMADSVTASCATHVLADSESQRGFLIAEGVVPADKIKVLANGSICGVDTNRFQPSPSARSGVRAELGIPEDAVVFLYLGRLNRDKGIPELARAFSRLASQRPDVWLVLVGPDEEGLQVEVSKVCSDVEGRLRLIGFTTEPERYMAMADVFCLPSHREGFGSVIIEAAACAVPAIATRIYGVSDAVQDEVTGVLFEPGSEDQLLAAMATMAENSELRDCLGLAAQQRALRDFPSGLVTSALIAYLDALLRERGRHV